MVDKNTIADKNIAPGSKTNGSGSKTNGSGSKTNGSGSKTEASTGKVTGRNILYYFGLFCLMFCILLVIYYFIGTLNRYSFNLDKLNDDFTRGTASKLHLSEDSGFDRNDYIDVEYNIRTADGSADCRIHGRANKDGLKYVRTKGRSDICEDLKKN